MLNEQYAYWKKEQKQKDLNLKLTRQAVDSYWVAKEKNMVFLYHDLCIVISAMAQLEWGKNTTVDDFTIPGKFIIQNGNKEEIL